MADDDHINRLKYAITDGSLKDKWTKEKLGTDVDLQEIFSTFLVEQEVYFKLLFYACFVFYGILCDVDCDIF